MKIVDTTQPEGVQFKDLKPGQCFKWYGLGYGNNVYVKLKSASLTKNYYVELAGGGLFDCEAPDSVTFPQDAEVVIKGSL